MLTRIKAIKQVHSRKAQPKATNMTYDKSSAVAQMAAQSCTTGIAKR